VLLQLLFQPCPKSATLQTRRTLILFSAIQKALDSLDRAYMACHQSSSTVQGHPKALARAGHPWQI
jgi:hypothetical protein